MSEIEIFEKKNSINLSKVIKYFAFTSGLIGVSLNIIYFFFFDSTFWSLEFIIALGLLFFSQKSS